MENTEMERTKSFLDSAELIAMDASDQRAFNTIFKNQLGESHEWEIPTLLDIYRAGLLAGHLKSALKERGDNTVDDEINIDELIGIIAGDDPQKLDNSSLYVEVLDFVQIALDKAFTAGYLRAIKDELQG